MYFVGDAGVGSEVSQMGHSSEDVNNKRDDGATIAHCLTEMTLGANLWGLKLITRGFCSLLTASWWLETLVRSNAGRAGVTATAKGRGSEKDHQQTVIATEDYIENMFDTEDWGITFYYQ